MKGTIGEGEQKKEYCQHGRNRRCRPALARRQRVTMASARRWIISALTRWCSATILSTTRRAHGPSCPNELMAKGRNSAPMVAQALWNLAILRRSPPAMVSRPAFEGAHGQEMVTSTYRVPMWPQLMAMSGRVRFSPDFTDGSTRTLRPARWANLARTRFTASCR